MIYQQKQQHQQQRQQKFAPVNNQAIMLALMSFCLLLLITIVPATQAYNPIASDQLESSGKASPGSVSLAVIENPEITAHVLESLLRSIIVSANVDFQSISTSIPQKRGLDLGISRGFSGSQAGKHLMGLSAASFANGPGRK